MRKGTRLEGTEEILQHCTRRCEGKHQHTPILGGVKIRNHWHALSDFAGGYTRCFANKVLDGAEQYLKKGGRQETYASRETVPEERMIPMEEEMNE